ncbi:Bifunctional inhibitor/plant lipid transfer protein/seed storage helical domain protein, partial [Melia azedarach]
LKEKLYMRPGMGSLKRSSPLNSIILLCIIIVMTMVISKVRMVGGEGLSPSQCMEERRLGVNACKLIIFGQPPSPACCARLRANHYECICPSITPKLASLISVNQTISLLKTCGKRVPRHFKCGNLHFP